MPLKQFSLIFPLAASSAALTIVLVHAAMFGVVHEADEGTAAHLFQLLMIAQVPAVAFFAMKWLPRRPSKALQVLALQGGSVLAAFAAVYLLT